MGKQTEQFTEQQKKRRRPVIRYSSWPAGFYAGHRVVLLIWHGLSAHWSTKMRAWLDSQRDWLTAERLPAYAPELNPVESLWANLKDLELANRPTTSLAEVATPPNTGIQRVCKSDSLVVGFLAHTGLSLDP